MMCFLFFLLTWSTNPSQTTKTLSAILALRLNSSANTNKNAMNRKISVIILLLASRICIAQNLVSNGSFENYSTCPGNSGQITKAVGWFYTNGSPDYFDTCAFISTTVGVPSNFAGFQYAATGGAYAGALCYGSFSPTYLPDFREFLTGTLSQPLTL